MSEYIPLEIQEEILKRLPVKPLIQFRSVSKPWKCLIDSPDFIVSYGVRHPPQSPDRFILRYLEPPSEYKNSNFVDKYLSFVDNDNDDDDHSFALQELIPTVPDLIKTLETHSDVVGSSHGLLCVNGYFEEYSDGDIFSYKVTEMVILWNPSISKSVGIEVPYMDVNKNFYHRPVNKIGFGVCPVTFDPIILKIKYLDYDDYKRKMKDMPGISVPWKVRVFTLSTGTWSILSTNLPRESIRLRGSPVVVNRFIYWVAYDMLDAENGRFRSDYLITSFDLTAKEFKEINLKDSLTNRLSSIHTISKLRESLVLLEYYSEFEEDVSVCCCLWMMKDQSDSRSFTKLYTINLPDVTINQILGSRKTGELILETREEFEQYAEVQIYDPNNEYTDNLGIYGEPFLFFMRSYMETLLLLDQSDGYIYSNSR